MSIVDEDHCACGKRFDEENPNCVFMYHKKPNSETPTKELEIKESEFYYNSEYDCLSYGMYGITKNQYESLKSQILNQSKQLQEIREKIKDIRERMEKDRPRANQQRKKVQHNCFLDGRLSGYLWACDELQKILGENK